MKVFLQVLAKESALHRNGITRSKRKNLKSRRNLKVRIKNLKRDVTKIREDQKSIKEEQRGMQKKLDEINENCNFIRSEAAEIAVISERTQSRLDLMFKILDARKNKDFVKANMLARSLSLLLVTTSNHTNDNGKKEP
ncbi:hypothetical protein ACFE04_029153 [Oxalis oulophora]